MAFEAQMLIVLVLVAAAALYVLRTAWRLMRGKSGGCCKKGCSVDEPARENGHVISSQELLRTLENKQRRD